MTVGKIENGLERGFVSVKHRLNCLMFNVLGYILLGSEMLKKVTESGLWW